MIEIMQVPFDFPSASEFAAFNSLSWEALGVLGFLIQNPQGIGLEAIQRDGCKRDKALRIMGELQAAGVIRVEPQRAQGRWAGMLYLPQSTLPYTENPVTVSPQPEIPDAVAVPQPENPVTVIEPQSENPVTVDPPQSEKPFTVGAPQPENPVTATAPESINPDAVKAWDAAYQQLEIQLDRQNFDTWVRETKLLGYEAGVYHIQARNSYARDMLQHRLYRNVRQILSDIFGQEIEIIFELPPQPENPVTVQTLESDSFNLNKDSKSLESLDLLENARARFATFFGDKYQALLGSYLDCYGPRWVLAGIDLLEAEGKKPDMPQYLGKLLENQQAEGVTLTAFQQRIDQKKPQPKRGGTYGMQNDRLRQAGVMP